MILSALVALSAFAWAETAEWSRFRGPNGGGAVEAGALPVEVGPDRNLLWRTAIPAGDSSPILSAKRIFLTASEGEALYTIALDRETGSELWRREAPRPRTETLDNRNGPASPSAVTDGEHVWVFFGDFGLLCYTVDGEELWRHPLGPFDNIYGMGASPILAAGNVVLVVDQQRDSYILAVDAGSGELAWRTERTAARSGHSTPTLHHPEGGELQIVVPGSFFLTGYSAATGERLWWVSGLSFEMKSTAAVEDDLLFINGYAMPLNEEGTPRPARTVPAKSSPRTTATGTGRSPRTRRRRASSATSCPTSTWRATATSTKGTGRTSRRRSTAATASSPSSCRQRISEET